MRPRSSSFRSREPPAELIPKPVGPYKPPAGFDSLPIGGTLQAATTFKKSHLEGKQIWYFTAPASVPISAIKETTLSALKNGDKVYSHNGNDYRFIEDAAEDITYTKIMVPNSSDDGYRAGETFAGLICFRSYSQCASLKTH